MDVVKLNKYYDSCPSYALTEAYPFRAAKSGGPRVLPAGVTVLLHAGAAASHGDPEDGSFMTCSNPDGNSVLRFNYRNSHLQLTGPLKASEVLQRFALHVMIEVRRSCTEAAGTHPYRDGTSLAASCG